MLQRLERRNDEIWAGHSSLFEDITHAVAGVGIGFLLGSALGERARSLGIAMIAVSAGLHLYASATARVPSRFFGR